MLLRSLLNGSFDLIEFLFLVPSILIALTLHEAAHAYAANKLGDPTARLLGRLTINPLAHLDPLGTVCLLLCGFGWGKPCPVNTRAFKNPKRDLALTSLAGPLANLLLGFLGVLLYRIFLAVFIAAGPVSSEFVYNLESFTLEFLSLFLSLNISLFVFNLLPVPPLDGSRLLFPILPDKLYRLAVQYERYIAIAIMLLLFTGLLSTPLSFLTSLIIRFFDFLVGLLPLL